jgi:signal transduction histidine kinase
MMQERQAGKDIAAYDQLIERSLTRIKGMRNLIMDLLDFTKIGWERKTKKLYQVNLNEIARMAINTIQPYAIQKNIQIFLHAQLPVSVMANTSDMEIIFNNLISNAVKYNYEDGRVDIELTSNDKFAIIRVEDTGIGIAPDEQQSIFHEFFRVKNDKTKEITGSGLGLSIVKKIIELYKGEISVSSTPDIGSTFTVKLPKN